MRNVKPHHIISGLAIGGLFLATLNFNTQPLFTDLNQFVLVAEDRIHLAGDVQVSSGDLAANGEIAIAGSNIISGNLFSDEIKIAGGTQINGDASFNELKLTQNSEILGITSTPISLPVIELPDIPDFIPGNQDLVIQEDQVISPGSFNKLEVKEGVTLTLNPGTYNLNELALRESSKLLFSSTTIINIKEELKINKRVLISQTTDIPSTDLIVNLSSQGRAQRLTSSLADSSERSRGKSSDNRSQGPPEDKPARKPETKPKPQSRPAPHRGSASKTPVSVVKPITIGEDSLISFKLVAPGSKVHLGNRVTFRGQILAEEIKVGEGSILSREKEFEKESDPTKIVEDGGIKFVVNEIVILFKEGATINDLLVIADFVGGQATGFLPDLEMGKIEVSTQTVEELNNLIDLIRSSGNPLIEEILPNALIL